MLKRLWVGLSVVQFLLLASAVSGQGSLTSEQWNSLSQFLKSAQSTQIMFSDAGKFGSDPLLTWNKTTDTFSASGTVVTSPSVANDNSTHFLSVTGTLPSSPSVFPEGVVFDITGAGTSDKSPFAVSFYQRPGYTGAIENSALYVLNETAGTASGYLLANKAIWGEAFATTTGNNVGVTGDAAFGGRNIGVLGASVNAVNGATNIGVVGYGANSGTTPITIGGYFGLNVGTNPTFESAALLADNAAVAAPIILARDNGTKVFSVEDSGALWAKIGTKTLVSATATAFVRVAVPSNGRQGGVVEFCVDADDGTDFQERCGTVPFAFVNKAGTETCTPLGTVSDVATTSAGTLTLTFDGISNAADTCDIRATADSSLTETTLRINHTLREFGNAYTAVTPQ